MDKPQNKYIDRHQEDMAGQGIPRNTIYKQGNEMAGEEARRHEHDVCVRIGAAYDRLATMIAQRTHLLCGWTTDAH